eukprot:TRINITY_DN590_c0_g1_i4.p2 TRINITY_DN590_c0_g1~~TRINITY_DN590_c0_g1_i4.p2  ORF type:complete len:109 (+),score=8.01 TRINITY_DN590_c0_g1_i4:395-721(+)
MGVDIRVMSADPALTLPHRLREAGYVVELLSEQHPGVVVTLATCRRGRETQRLGWNAIPSQPGVYHVGIGNAWAWRRSVLERRRRLLEEVTFIIEKCGGRPLFEDGDG